MAWDQFEIASDANRASLSTTCPSRRYPISYRRHRFYDVPITHIGSHEIESQALYITSQFSYLTAKPRLVMIPSSGHRLSELWIRVYNGLLNRDQINRPIYGSNSSLPLEHNICNWVPCLDHRANSFSANEAHEAYPNTAYYRYLYV